MPADRLAISALLFGIVLIPLQIFPAMPLAGMQAADAFFLVAAVAAVMARPSLAGLGRTALVLAVAFGAWTGASALANGGLFEKLVGHGELVVIAVLVALWTRPSAVEGMDTKTREQVERALVAAALVAAVSAVVGVALFYLGHETALLNPHSGDLVGDGYPRARGLTVRANQMASIVATGWLLLIARPGLLGHRGLRMVAHGLLLVALAFSMSRTIPFALLMAALLWVSRTDGKRGTAAWLGWSIAFATCLAGIMMLSRYQVNLDPMRPWAFEVTVSPATRWIHGARALETAIANPLFGVGPGRYAADGWSAHMTWINVWALLGLPAVLAFAGLFARGLLNRSRLFTGAWLALALLATDALHRDIEDMRHLWVLLGLLAFDGEPAEETAGLIDESLAAG